MEAAASLYSGRAHVAAALAKQRPQALRRSEMTKGNLHGHGHAEVANPRGLVHLTG
jgi:hypothetical protein